MKYAKQKNQLNSALIISHILPNSIAEKARFLHKGLIIAEVNNFSVKTISELKIALLKSIKTGFVTIKIESGEFFVGFLKEILQDEKKLSMIYFYQISDIVNNLIKNIDLNTIND